MNTITKTDIILKKVINYRTMIIIYLLLFPISGKILAQELMPVEYNKDNLVRMAVQGQIAEARMSYPPYRIGSDGTLSVVPGTGSITYNYRTGDSAIDVAGDHIEPAVTLYHPNGRQSAESVALNVLSCIGNEAVVITGNARGARGFVIGKHGGSEHVMVDFPDPTVLDNLLLGDRMHIHAVGTGMDITNIKDVKAMNMSPTLLESLTDAGMGITPEGKLRISVTHLVPAKIMGSGLGRNHAYSGDYDIQLFDEMVNEKYDLGTLRLGDIVAIINADTSYGRIYKTGAVTIGVVTHGRSIVAGHGPGVTTLFTSPSGNIEPVIDDDANLKNLLLH